MCLSSSHHLRDTVADMFLLLLVAPLVGVLHVLIDPGDSEFRWWLTISKQILELQNTTEYNFLQSLIYTSIIFIRNDFLAMRRTSVAHTANSWLCKCHGYLYCGRFFQIAYPNNFDVYILYETHSFGVCVCVPARLGGRT